MGPCLDFLLTQNERNPRGFRVSTKPPSHRCTNSYSFGGNPDCDRSIIAIDYVSQTSDQVNQMVQKNDEETMASMLFHVVFVRHTASLSVCEPSSCQLEISSYLLCLQWKGCIISMMVLPVVMPQRPAMSDRDLL